MESKLETVQLLFQLIVDQLDAMEQGERPFTRIEWVGEGLEVDHVGGESYKIEVKPLERKVGFPLPEATSLDQSGRQVAREDDLNVQNQREEENGVITLKEEKWEDLVQTCELVIQFLEYDMNKMAELSEQVPDFPWKKRADMMEGLVERLREALDQSEREKADMRF
ncbi:hypothetical protein SAMN05444487_11484 [Marininema mesophilum]|uniref:Uncharacterized protein n=1 Tax=Marininema mesophilum TaxID=1048340 RepID=A0A1H3AYA9_9BACL|nr:hypothetical protein [Marininema mesophilum]SDX34104.1 hypothetical protein SAMN05444487_11484 [Marininema mesophilum]